MTEAEWLTCRRPELMLNYLRDNATDRKLRLLACACCRLVWGVLTAEYARRAVEVSERFAEGDATAEELDAAAESVADLWDAMDPDGMIEDGVGSTTPGEYRVYRAIRAAFWAACRDREFVTKAHFEVGEATEHKGALRAAACGIWRDIFPFHPISLHHSWLTSTVTALAQGMYDSRDFSAMPILADALQDAGCDNDEILQHCRGLGPHVRGCWVVDACLGKG